MKFFPIFFMLFFVELFLETGFQINSKIAEGFSLKNLFIYGVSIILIFSKIYSPKKYKLHRDIKRIVLLHFLFITIAMLSILYASMFGFSGYQVTTGFIYLKSFLIDGIICLIIFTCYFSDKNNCDKLMQIMIVIVAGFSFLTLVEVTGLASFYGLDDDSARPNGPLGEPNQTAAVLAMFIPVTLSYIFVQKKSQIIFVASALIMLAALIATSSRGGIVAIAIGGFLWAWFMRKELKLAAIILLLAAVPTLVVAALFVLPEYYQLLIFDRFDFVGKQDIDVNNVSAGRVDAWLFSLEYMKQSPIFGMGWGAYKILSGGGATHNTYVDYLTSTGILGCGIYLYTLRRMYSAYGLKLNKHKKREKILLIGIKSGFCALLVAIFFVNLYIPFTIALCFLGLGLAYANNLYRENMLDKYNLLRKRVE